MIFDLFGTLFSILLFVVAIIIVRRWEKENILGKEVYFTFKDNLLWWSNFWNLFAYLPNNF